MSEIYIQRTRGSKTSTNEGKWLAPRGESSLGRVRTSLTSMYGVPSSPNTDINNILFDVARPSGAGPSIGGEIQTPYRPGPNVRQLGKNSTSPGGFGAKGRFFAPISRPIPFESSHRDESNGLGPSVGSNFGHRRLVGGRRQWVTSTRLSIAENHKEHTRICNTIIITFSFFSGIVCQRQLLPRSASAAHDRAPRHPPRLFSSSPAHPTLQHDRYGDLDHRV